MRVRYIKEYKNQKDNAFCKIGKQQPRLLEELIKRLTFVCEASQSRDPDLQGLWQTFTEPDKIFGRSQRNQHTNSGLSALSGAVAKLQVGDLSEKQIKNIQPVCVILNKMFPEHFEEIIFEDTENIETTWGNGLFHSD